MKTFELQQIALGGPGRRQVLQDISLTIEPGECVALVGLETGALGEVLRLAAGLAQPDSGHVVARPNKMGYVFRDGGLMSWLSVSGNIQFGLTGSNQHPKAVQRSVSEQLERFDLAGLEACYPDELTASGRQRVSLARALAADPQLILLDNPFASVDPASAEALRGEFAAALNGSGAAKLLVTASPEEAVLLADRVLVCSARPVRVEKSLAVSLPRPRDPRAPEFFKLADRIRKLLG